VSTKAGLGVCVMRGITRERLWGLAAILVLGGVVAAVYGCVTSLNHQSSIWVYGIDSSSDETLSYNIGSSRIVMTGDVNEFKTRTSKDKLFAGLRVSFPVFAETKDRIQLIHNRQIYTVRQYTDGHYALYGESFAVRDSIGEFSRFPFPTDKISDNAAFLYDPIPVLQSTRFTVNCDLPYLLRFYAVYGNAVNVEGNRISYGGTAITVKDGGLIEVDVS
jgi:hypothetical protein